MFPRCKEEFSDLRRLFKHTQEQHLKVNNKNEELDKKFQCDQCDSSFGCKNNFNRHMEQIHQVESKKNPTVICPLCDGDQAFQTVLILEKHLTKQHNVELKEGDLEFDSLQGGDCFNNTKYDIILILEQ